jgi:hypothetical protein
LSRSEEFIAMFKLNSAESLSRPELISLRKSIFDCCRIAVMREAILAATLAKMLTTAMPEMAAHSVRA